MINIKNLIILINLAVFTLFYWDFRSYSIEQTDFIRECIAQQKNMADTLTESHKGLVQTQLGLMESYSKLSASYKILCESNSKYIESYNNFMKVIMEIKERTTTIETELKKIDHITP